MTHNDLTCKLLEEPKLTLDDAINILADGRPIRRSLRRAAIDVIRKAQRQLKAYENLYIQAGSIEKQIAINVIENFERDTKDMVRLLKERYNINE